MENVYITDELENAIDYLEQTVFFFNDIQTKHRIKWTLISLHGALYGFGILAIRGSNPTNTVYKPLEKTMKKNKLDDLRVEARERLKEHDPKYVDMFIKPSEGKLLDINTVIERCQDEKYMTRYDDSKTLALSGGEQESIKKMIDFRNQFAHFKPSLYAITEDYLVQIIRPILRVINFLALECNNILYYEERDKRRVEQAFQKVNM